MSWFKKKEEKLFKMPPVLEVEEVKEDYLNSEQLWSVSHKWQVMNLNKGEMEYWFVIVCLNSPIRYEIRVSKEFYDAAVWSLTECPLIKLNYNKYMEEKK